MADVTISLDRLPLEIRRTCLLIENAGEKACRRAARMGIGIVQNTINETEPYVPVDTGQYRRAWTVEDIPGGADLFNPTMYAPVIEYGSRPHWVPFHILFEWALRKTRGANKGVVHIEWNPNAARVNPLTGKRDPTMLGRFVRKKGAALRQAKKDLHDRAAWDLAARAQRSIAGKGIEPRDILGRSDAEFTRALVVALDSILQESLRRP